MINVTVLHFLSKNNTTVPLRAGPGSPWMEMHKTSILEIMPGSGVKFREERGQKS